MRRIYSLIIVVMLCTQLNAQVVVDNSQTVQSVVEDLFLANGIFVANVVFNGAPANVTNEQFASFSDVNQGIGISGGLLLSTGHALDAAPGGPFNYITNEYYNQDQDVLDLLTNEMNLGSVASLEFDFIATGDSLDFQYVFGSDEYPEFVESVFNDHFGFFVSGPGISGPYSNNGVNIALIPGTNESVGINSLNAVDYSQFYVDNSNYTIPVGFDAFTTVLHASIGQLQVGEIYHVKIIIADVSDSALDSGVFLKGDSFVQLCSPGLGVMPDQCMLSNLHATVEYTEECGTISLTNTSELNIETTGCYFEMGDGNETAACDANTMYTYASAGTYPIKLVYMVNNFKAKFTVANLLVSDIAPATPVITQAGNTLTVSNWDGTSSLQWYINGAVLLGATGTSINIEEAGAYTVVANNGCPTTSAAYSVVGISELMNENEMALYPNPSEGMANVKLPKNACTLQLYNMNGQMIANQMVKNMASTQLTAACGVYSIRVADENGQTLATQIWMVK
jgi:PKD repeat protein